MTPGTTDDEGEVTVLISYSVPYDSWLSITGGRSGHPPGSTQTEPEPPPSPPDRVGRESAHKPGRTEREIAIVFPSLKSGVDLTGPELLTFLDASTRVSLVKLVWEHELVRRSHTIQFRDDCGGEETV